MDGDARSFTRSHKAYDEGRLSVEGDRGAIIEFAILVPEKVS